MKNVRPIIELRAYPRYGPDHSRGCNTARAVNGTRIVHQRPRSEPARRLATKTVSIFAYARMRYVPRIATRIRNTPRIRVRPSPRPASRIGRHLRPIIHLPGRL